MKRGNDAVRRLPGDAMKRRSEEVEERDASKAEPSQGRDPNPRSGLTHKDLDIWRIGLDIVELIYKTTEGFPQREYGLTSDMRRAAVSVPSNIAEGAARNSDKEFIRFLYISLGSLSELETQVTIAMRLGYIADEHYLSELIEKERRKLLNYIKYRKERG